jgi:hypothetical protein
MEWLSLKDYEIVKDCCLILRLKHVDGEINYSTGFYCESSEGIVMDFDLYNTSQWIVTHFTIPDPVEIYKG